MPTPEILAAIKLYIPAGLICVPARDYVSPENDGKSPIDPWKTMETKQEAGVSWHRHPNATRCGFLCKPSGILVVDLDIKDDETRGEDVLADWLASTCGLTWEEIEAEVVNHPVACSTPGGGFHLYFRVDDPADYPERSTRTKVLPGVDLRGAGKSAGGFIMAPPSTDPRGAYEWLSPWTCREDIPVIPAWLRRLCEWERAARPKTQGSPPPAPADFDAQVAAAHHLRRSVADAEVGCRNDVGFHLAAQLRDLGLPVADAEYLMVDYVLQVPQGNDRYTEREALASLAQAYGGAQREPAVPALARPRPARSQTASSSSGPMPDDEDPPLPDDDYAPPEVGTWDLPPEVMDQNTQREIMEDLARLDLNDEGNAQAFARIFGESYRYEKMREHGGRLGSGAWYRWIEHHWQATDDAVQVRDMIHTMQVRQSAASIIPDEDYRKAVIKYCKGSTNAAKLLAALMLASTHPKLCWGTKTVLDSDPWTLSCANGILDLKTGALRDGHRDDLLTKTTRVPYVPDATAPRWEQFLLEVFQGNEAMVDFIRRSIGYTLTGSTKEQVMFLLHGRGSNGKSVFLDAIRAAIGDYGDSTPFSTFEASQNSDRQTNDIAGLRGARLVTASEAEQGKRIDEARIKAVTGEQLIKARFLFAEFFEYTPTYKIWLSANHKPNIKGIDDGIWRRIRLVPFHAKFEGNDIDPDLGKKLAAEKEGILAWAVQGCLDWQLMGLDAPAGIVEATQDYRAEQDVFGGFINDAMEIDDDSYTVTASELFMEYNKWAENNGVRKRLTKNMVGRQMTARGFRKDHNEGGAIYTGVRAKFIPQDDGPFRGIYD